MEINCGCSVIFSLILFFLVHCSHQASMPLEITVCQSLREDVKGCVPLSKLAISANDLVRSHTIIKFYPGRYYLYSLMIIKGVSNISFTGMGLSTPNVMCTRRDSGIAFMNVDGIFISNLTFSNCGVNGSYFKPKTKWYSYASFIILESQNLIMDGVIVQHGRGYGVSGSNILGNSTITNSVFTNMTEGGGFYLLYQNTLASASNIQHNITFVNSQFTNNSMCMENSHGAGLAIHPRQTFYTVRVCLLEVQVVGNRAWGTAGIVMSSMSPNPNSLLIERSVFSHNSVLYAGTSGFSFQHLTAVSTSQNSPAVVIEIVNSNFTENIGIETHLQPDDRIPSNVIDFTVFATTTHNPHIIGSVRGCIVANNVGGSNVAIHAGINTKLDTHQNDILTIKVVGSQFVNNTSTAYMNNKRSTVGMMHVKNATFVDCFFANNTGTALLADTSKIYLQGSNIFAENKAYNGAGLSLYGDSYLYLHLLSITKFVKNQAENTGGGIYVARTTETIERSHCFFQFYDIVGYYIFNNLQVTLLFSNNSAKLSGNDVFGGRFSTCYVDQQYYAGRDAIVAISHTIGDYTLDISSKPLRVCHCNADFMPDCWTYSKMITTYPGKKFTLPLLAVGQLVFKNFTLGVPSAIYASLQPQTGNDNSQTLPSSLHVQEGGRTCSELTYSISSRNEHEIMVLTTEKADLILLQNLETLLDFDNNWYSHSDLISQNPKIPIYINVTLAPCPLGFELSTRNVCECVPRLTQLRVNCSIDALVFHKEPLIWIGTRTLQGSEKRGDNFSSSLSMEFLTHEHCPFDYCMPSYNFSLNNSDTQCAHGRSGILCGDCKPGSSLILGSSKCKECSNKFLALLVPFAFAGLLLILFLILTNMTVASGTVNGLMFYANVVIINKSSLFPPNTDSGVLFTFIAWLNLDLGIDTCFYDGLDSYANAWLQFVFPLYICLLATLIIVASKYFKIVNRVCGRNIVPVLATLFLLSYTKLQRAIITSLSFTIVNSDRGSFAVWLSNGNIQYLHGKHVYIFLFAAASLCAILLPYTLAIFLGPWLQSWTQHKLLTWVITLKPVYDAYLGPFKDRFRCWAGVLLLARGLLLIIAAVNVLGDTSINLLGMSIVSCLLVALVWQFSGVYKLWPVSCVESFFLLNLSILASVTLYNKTTGGNQYVAISISTGSALVVFLLLLLYHLLTYIKNVKVLILKLQQSYNCLGEVNNNRGHQRDDDDEEILNLLDSGRNEGTAVSSTVIDIPKQLVLSPKDLEMDTY